MGVVCGLGGHRHWPGLLVNGMILAWKSARSSADQSIGLRSQGSWVRIPPGAPPLPFRRIAPPPPEPMMKRISFVTSLIAAIAFCASALAQQYPAKAITLLVPYAAGGPTDTVA